MEQPTCVRSPRRSRKAKATDSVWSPQSSRVLAFEARFVVQLSQMFEELRPKLCHQVVAAVIGAVASVEDEPGCFEAT